MSRSERENRSKRNYSSARERADQKEKEASFTATYLKRPPEVKMFKPKVGIMLLDIIPYEAGKGNPCAEPGTLHYERTYYLHPRVGASSHAYLCPRLSSKERCPICEMRAKLLKNGSEQEELIKDLAPKERQLFNVINLKEPDKGIQLWDFSYHLFGKLLDARIRNADEEDGWDKFFFLEEGLTLKVGFTEKSFGDRTFLEVETIDFRARKEDYDDDILEKTIDLDSVLVSPDYDELKAAFLETEKAKDDDDEDDDAPPARKRKPVDTDDDDDEEEKPRKHKPADDDEDEPAPKKKARDIDEDEEEEVRKVRKVVDDDDDEEDRPKKKSKKDEDDDNWDDFDEKPKKKAKDTDEDDDDEEEKPRKKSRAADPDDDDEEEEKPRVKSRDQELAEEDEEEEKPRRRR